MTMEIQYKIVSKYGFTPDNKGFIQLFFLTTKNMFFKSKFKLRCNGIYKSNQRTFITRR